MENNNHTNTNPLFWLYTRLYVPLGEAVRFLTLLPVPGLPPMTETSMIRSIPWFPLAGFIIGLVLLPIGWLGGTLWDPLVRAALLVVAWGVVTGGLHLDGLSDTFDAVMSWRPQERKLEIMKDSRIGAMGALAIVGVLLLKVTWLQAAGDGWWQALIVAAVCGRWADIYGIYFFPAAREGGLGRTFHEQVQQPEFVTSTVATLLLTLLVGGGRGLLAGAAVLLVSWLLARWWTRTLGGLTGDTYGALCEIGETVALAVMVVWAHR